MIIGVDLDEVLSETIDEVLKYHNYEFNGFKISKNDITSYYINEIRKLGLTYEQAVKTFREVLENDKDLSIKPVEGALDKLKEWNKKGYKIIIITARNYRFKSYTISWLNKYYLGLYSDVIFTGYGKYNQICKSKVCKLNLVDVMIEDNLEYANNISSNSDINVYLFNKPWNVNKQVNDKVIRVNSWYDIKL